jgi:hypothetical protein
MKKLLEKLARQLAGFNVSKIKSTTKTTPLS